MSDEVDPFSVDDDENEGDAAPQADNSTIKQMREALERAEKRNKTYEKQLEKLTEFQNTVLGERREQAVTSVFTEAGLNPKHAELYKRLNPDIEVESITADAVNAFASEYGLAASSGEVPEAPEVQPEGFTPVTTGSAAPAQYISEEQIKEWLNRGDVEAVNAAYASGRVQKESVPWRQFPG